jgi:hypothetical protein
MEVGKLSNIHRDDTSLTILEALHLYTEMIQKMASKKINKSSGLEL